MATRQEFLAQLQDQLASWTRWVQELQGKVLTNADKVRDDAKAVYKRRAAHVSQLIEQGRGQIDRLVQTSDDAWDGISAGAEQAWNSLRDVAESLAAQPDPADAPPARRRSASPAKSAKNNKKKPAKKAAAKKAVPRKKKAFVNAAGTKVGKKKAKARVVPRARAKASGARKKTRPAARKK